MKKVRYKFLIGAPIILALLLLAIFGLGSIKGAKDIRLGIDTRGGVEAVFTPVDLKRDPTDKEMESSKRVIELRMDGQNILDREVTIDKKNNAIIVRFPWKSDEKEFDPNEAIKELGAMAKLTFQDDAGKVYIDGSAVADAKAGLDQETNKPIVDLEFKPEGAKQLEEATNVLYGKTLIIKMDETQIFSGTVSARITDGRAQITGLGTMDEATKLAANINAGALPFSLQTSNNSTISPSLGQDALKIMIYAGLIAFVLVMIFMIGYYRLPGFVSIITLIFQVSVQLLCLSVPQMTLTLPGIAGLILSVGMAVDANIIISERISEEIKKGKTIRSAIVVGNHNAFSSVLDGNLTTAIVAVILMIFGSGTMLSFGYTLLTGVILNLLVVLISKQLLTGILGFERFNKEKFFLKKKDQKQLHFYKKRWYAFGLSICIVVVGFILCFVKGVKLDTMFSGGAILKYSYEKDVDVSASQKAVSDTIDRTCTIQLTNDLSNNSDKMVVTLAGKEGLSSQNQDKLYDALKKANPNSDLKLVESYVVEPYIGKQALQDSAIAIILAMIFITLYVWVRFRSIGGLSAGLMSLVALVHDVAFVFFAFVIFGIPLNDAFVAVTLTILGYSINDTIVMFDRVRENNRSVEYKGQSIDGVVEHSITQTFSRSINTSITTTMCILCVLIMAILYGISSIRVFALPMLLGLISGCYSSVFLAGPLWVRWKLRKKRA